jgi:hypothetical protein
VIFGEDMETDIWLRDRWLLGTNGKQKREVQSAVDTHKSTMAKDNAKLNWYYLILKVGTQCLFWWGSRTSQNVMTIPLMSVLRC